MKHTILALAAAILISSCSSKLYVAKENVNDNCVSVSVAYKDYQKTTYICDSAGRDLLQVAKAAAQDFSDK